jgi:hypothetical protein
VLGCRWVSRPPCTCQRAFGGDRYLDPIALAALIVSAAQWAWSVYVDLRKRTAQPAPQVGARAGAGGAGRAYETAPEVRDRVIDIVVAETHPPGHE